MWRSVKQGLTKVGDGYAVFGYHHCIIFIITIAKIRDTLIQHIMK